MSGATSRAAGRTAAPPQRAGSVLCAGRLAWRETSIDRPTGTGWLLTFTVAGRGLYRDPSGDAINAEAGDLLLLGPGVPGHDRPRGAKWDAFWLRFEPWRAWRPTGFDRLSDAVYRAHITRPGHRQRMHEVWTALIADLHARDTARILNAAGPRGGASPAGAGAADDELLVLLLREIFVLARRDAATSAQLDPRIRDALEVMERDLASPPDMRQLAARAGLSYSRFAHLFKAQLGMSPKRVQQTIRLRRGAVQLEYSDDPVGVIATRLGFSTIFDFSRAFRRDYGTSPSAYRRRHR